MKVKLLSFGVAVLIAACATAPQSNQHLPLLRTAQSGQPLHINTWHELHPDCSNAGVDQISILVAPAHGVLNIEPWTDFPNYPYTNARFNCNSTKRDGVRVAYTSTNGYVGHDRFVLRVLGPDGYDNSWDYRITVDPSGSVAAPAAR